VYKVCISWNSKEVMCLSSLSKHFILYHSAIIAHKGHSLINNGSPLKWMNI